jgi:hypothetical protein
MLSTILLFLVSFFLSDLIVQLIKMYVKLLLQFSSLSVNKWIFYLRFDDKLQIYVSLLPFFPLNNHNLDIFIHNINNKYRPFDIFFL